MRQYIGFMAALSLSGGIIIADKCSLPCWLGLSWFVIFLILAWIWRRKNVWFCLAVSLAFLGLAVVRLDISETRYNSLPRYENNRDAALTLKIGEKKGTYETDKGEVTKYIASIQSERPEGKIYLTVKGADPYPQGTTVQGDVRMKDLTLFKNDGLYDFYHYYRQQAVVGRGEEKKKGNLTVCAEAGVYDRTINLIHANITSFFKEILGGDRAYILTSLLFGGNYDRLPPAVLQSFAATGLIHILSVSGAHITLVLAVVTSVGKLFSVRNKTLYLLAGILVFFYSALSSFTVPVLRSACMGLIGTYALAAEREYTPLHVLGLVMTGFVLYNPYLAYDLAFRLSCGATAGIILFSRRLNEIFSFITPFIRLPLTLSISAQLLLVPFLTDAFAVLPTYTFFANLLVGTILDAVIVMGLAAALFVYISPPVGKVLLMIIGPLLDVSLKGNFFLASLPYSRFPAGAMTAQAVCVYLLLIGAVFFKDVRKFCLFGSLAVCIFAAARFLAAGDRAELYIFDLHDDAAICIVDTAGEARLWYNKKQPHAYSPIASVLVPALRHEGIFSLSEVRVYGAGAERAVGDLTENFRINEIVFGAATDPDISFAGLRIHARTGTIDGLPLNTKKHGQIKGRYCREHWRFKTYNGESYEIR